MNLGQEYLIFTFLICCGVVQVAVSYSELDRLMFFRDKRFSTVFGIGLMLGSLAWFFRDGGRNIPDTADGIAGTAQFSLFLLGAFLALAFTFTVTSFTKSDGRAYDNTIDGLSSLKEITFFRALSRNVSILWTLYRKLTQKYSSG